MAKNECCARCGSTLFEPIDAEANARRTPRVEPGLETLGERVQRARKETGRTLADVTAKIAAAFTNPEAAASRYDDVWLSGIENDRVPCGESDLRPLEIGYGLPRGTLDDGYAVSPFMLKRGETLRDAILRIRSERNEAKREAEADEVLVDRAFAARTTSGGSRPFHPTDLERRLTLVRTELERFVAEREVLLARIAELEQALLNGREPGKKYGVHVCGECGGTWSEGPVPLSNHKEGCRFFC